MQSKLPDTLLALCLEGIHRSTTPEQLATTANDLAEIRNANPDFDWTPVYRAYSAQLKQIGERHEPA